MQRLNKGYKQIRPWVSLGLVLGLSLTVLSGCYCGWINPPSALKKDFGRSVENNKVAQVVNPAAGFDERPPVGMSPVAGANTQERYDKTFKRDEVAPPTMNLNVLGGGGGGGGK